MNVDQVIRYLNWLNDQDPKALRALIEAKVSCNETLARNPVVQVSYAGDIYNVGLLGVINGMFGTISEGPRQGWGKITYVISDTGATWFERTNET